MAGIILCETSPEVTERSGLFIVELLSGGDKFTLALSQRDICILASRSMQAVNAQARRRQADVIPLRAAQEGR